MDDLEYNEYLEYPCRICGSCEYRYYGGGYNCREGHRNDELCEQVADEDDFEISRSQMRLSMSKMTPQTARVTTRKFRTRSGKGDHDINARYGITSAEQQRLFEQENQRFNRNGSKYKYTILEVAMQVLILQVETVKSIQSLWTPFGDDCERKKREFEDLARKLFQAWANELKFPYSHTDTLHPEIVSLAPPPYKRRFCFPSKKKKNQVSQINSSSIASPATLMDDLDRELYLDDYDYGNESSLSDTSEEEEDDDYNDDEDMGSGVYKGTGEPVEFGRLLEITEKPVDADANDAFEYTSGEGQFKAR